MELKDFTGYELFEVDQISRAQQVYEQLESLMQQLDDRPEAAAILRNAQVQILGLVHESVQMMQVVGEDDEMEMHQAGEGYFKLAKLAHDKYEWLSKTLDSLDYEYRDPDARDFLGEGDYSFMMKPEGEGKESASVIPNHLYEQVMRVTGAIDGDTIDFDKLPPDLQAQLQEYLQEAGIMLEINYSDNEDI